MAAVNGISTYIAKKKNQACIKLILLYKVDFIIILYKVDLIQRVWRWGRKSKREKEKKKFRENIIFGSTKS